MPTELEQSILDATYGERETGYLHPEHRLAYAQKVASGMSTAFGTIDLSNVSGSVQDVVFADSPCQIGITATIIRVICIGGPVSLILPSAGDAVGRTLILKMDSACSKSHPVTVTTKDGGLIDGSSSFTFDTSRSGSPVWSNGTEWFLV